MLQSQDGHACFLQPAPSLPVMALLAQGLPVAFVPEEPQIAPVRQDMVDHRRRRQYAALQTGGAQGIARQKTPAGFPPVRAVSAFCGAAPPAFRGFALVFCAIRPFLAQVRAAGIPTGPLWTFGHCISPRFFPSPFWDAFIAYRMSSPRWLYTESPPFRFFIARSSAMTSATAPSTFSVDFSLSILILPAGSVRT